MRSSASSNWSCSAWRRSSASAPSLEVAYEAAGSLQLLIGDILDVAKIESGHLTLTPERVRLRHVVESVRRMFEGLARQKA